MSVELIQDADDSCLYLGDNLELLRSLPDDCVDLVITSPPYEDARLYSMGFKLQGQVWVDWAVERYIECVRVCKGLVVWVVEGRTKQFRYSASPILMMADLHRRGVRLRKPPIYRRYGIPGSGGPDWLRNDYEFCIAAAKGKLPWSDNTAKGSPTKYDVGGQMSNRTQDGRRRNAETGIRHIARLRQYMRGLKSPTLAMSSTRCNAPHRQRNLIVSNVAPHRVPAQPDYTAQEVAALMADKGDLADCKVRWWFDGERPCPRQRSPLP